MNNGLLQVISNSQFGNIRTIIEGGNILFCGADVAKALGYSNTKDAILRHCHGVVKRDLTDNLGRQQEASFVPEPDLYRLIARSQLESAQEFERWIFEEVLPSIRKTGIYMTAENREEFFTNPDNTVRIVSEWKNEYDKRVQLEAQAAIDAPKVEFADQVASSDDCIDIKTLANFIAGNGIKIGRNRLFSWLRENNILMEDNTPYQRYNEAGYFKVIEQTYPLADGKCGLAHKTLVTGKGQQYILRRLKDSLAPSPVLQFHTPMVVQ